MPDEVGVQRVDIGFTGGQVLSLRLTRDAYDGLRQALSSDRSERWHGLRAHDSEVSVDLAQVVYVRFDTDDQRVGF